MNILNKSYLNLWVILVLLCLFTNCKNAKERVSADEADSEEKENLIMRKQNFGTTPEGEKVEQYILKNTKGMEVKIITYGGRISSLKVPDNKGNFENVVLGFNCLDEYVGDNPFFGALIGRYANRIAKGKFSLDGEEYSLAQNDGENHLHGGEKGFDRVVWKVEKFNIDKNILKLSYISKDMEEGYPGRLETLVTYVLTDDNSLDVEYEATTDKKTIVNLTQHSYFNLSGDFSTTILDHKVKINADAYLPVDETSIPIGEIRPVAGTPFDFNEAKIIGKNIEDENKQLMRGNGYDHCWILNDMGYGVDLAASAYHLESGRVLEVYTNEPSIQFYTGNHLDGKLPQNGGEGTYGRRSGFCLETQHYPDSPNQKKFPSVVLKPREKYTSKTSFRFSVK